MSRQFTKQHVKTRVIDKGFNKIMREIATLKDGATISTGILKEDFDKKAKFKGKVVSEVPLGYYAAQNVYGDPTAGIPKRDFMTRTLNKHRDELMQSTINGIKKIHKPHPTYTVEQLCKSMAKKLRTKMKSTIKTFGGKNSTEWLDTKKQLGMNTDVLQATNTMYKNIRSEYKMSSNVPNKMKYSEFFRGTIALHKRITKAVEYDGRL